ncbi:MAG: hypothetical protein ACHQ1D_00845 [Nitrososphaerales archaeon]
MPTGKPKRGRPRYQQIKNLKIAKALLKTNTEKEAYIMVHGEGSEKSAANNSHRLLSHEVMEEVRRIIALEKIGIATRENIEKLIMPIITGYLTRTDDRIKTSDYNAALKLLKELIVGLDIPKTEEELNARLKALGWNPENETGTFKTDNL